MDNSIVAVQTMKHARKALSERSDPVRALVMALSILLDGFLEVAIAEESGSGENEEV